MLSTYKVIDISQPVTSETACFPGDSPFFKQMTLTFKDSRVVNLTKLTMSPHVGTHADAPIHCYGDLESGQDTAGSMPLEPFVGPALVIDLSPTRQALTVRSIFEKLHSVNIPARILVKTARQIKYEIFEDEYAYFDVELIDYLAERGVRLLGIDTPSVDYVQAKILSAHAALIKRHMYWLENLDLTEVSEGEYFLCALPLKFMELEASPVRAVLLAPSKEG